MGSARIDEPDLSAAASRHRASAPSCCAARRDRAGPRWCRASGASVTLLGTRRRVRPRAAGAMSRGSARSPETSRGRPDAAPLRGRRGTDRRRQDEPRAPARAAASAASWCSSRARRIRSSSASIATRAPRRSRRSCYFLFQRARQLQDLRQADLFERVRVADYLLDKDRLFAQAHARRRGVRAVRAGVRAARDRRARCPTSSSTCRRRSTCCSSASPGAASPYEQVIERATSSASAESYTRFFLEYEAAPVLIVNAAEIDPVGSEPITRACWREVVRARRGRHYFNPMKSLL